MKPFDINARMTMGELLGTSREYVVPPFQRDYSWDNEHWEELWEDIERMGEGEQHYMGYIVLQGLPGNGTRYVIIDGQQRIATLSIFANAVISILQKPAPTAILFQSAESGGDAGGDALRDGRRQRGKLMNRFLTWDDPVSLTLRSRLTLNGKNDTFYRYHILQDRKPASQVQISPSNKRMWQALEFFRSKLRERFSESFTGEELARLLSDKVANGLFFTEMRVDNRDMAYTIFETLNARGATLSSPDLLKNLLFSVVEEGSDEDHRRLEYQWGNMLAILDQADSTTFMRHLWHSMGGPFARKKDLFKVMRRKIESKGAEAALDFMNKLEDGAAIYAAMHKPTASEWKDKAQLRYLCDLKTYGVTSHFPLTLAAYWKWKRTANFAKLLRLCAALSFRRTIIGGQVANELERVYAEAAAAVHCDRKSIADVCNCLRVADVQDDLFVGGFEAFNAESSKAKRLAKHILSEIECHASGGNAPRFDLESSDITIEHILPQDHSKGWGDFGSDRDRFVWRLGNLTLLSADDNRKCGNLSFAKKRDIYRGSKFKMTRELANFDKWNIENLEIRQRQFAKLAQSIWRLE